MPSLAAGLRNRSRRHGRLVDHTNALRLSRPYRRLARDIVWCRSHNNPLPAYQHLHSGRGQAVVRRAAIMVSTATSPKAVFQSCVDIVRVNSRWPNRCEHKRQESTDQRPRDRRAAEQRDELAPLHSITSSTRPSSGSGTVMPSALAVLRFSNIWIFVDC